MFSALSVEYASHSFNHVLRFSKLLGQLTSYTIQLFHFIFRYQARFHELLYNSYSSVYGIAPAQLKLRIEMRIRPVSQIVARTCFPSTSITFRLKSTPIHHQWEYIDYQSLETVR